MKRGFTLVELIVAMGLFSIVATLAIGALVTVSNIKTLSGTMRESQQKTRIALEVISRLSRQADIVNVPDTETVELFFNTDGASPKWNRFQIVGTQLFYTKSCTSGLNLSTLTCGTPGGSTDMLVGATSDVIALQAASGFRKTIENGSPELEVILSGQINGPRFFHKDSMYIITAIILDGLK